VRKILSDGLLDALSVLRRNVLMDHFNPKDNYDLDTKFDFHTYLFPVTLDAVEVYYGDNRTFYEYLQEIEIQNNPDGVPIDRKDDSYNVYDNVKGMLSLYDLEYCCHITSATFPKISELFSYDEEDAEFFYRWYRILNIFDFKHHPVMYEQREKNSEILSKIPNIPEHSWLRTIYVRYHIGTIYDMLLCPMLYRIKIQRDHVDNLKAISDMLMAADGFDTTKNDSTDLVTLFKVKDIIEPHMLNIVNIANYCSKYSKVSWSNRVLDYLRKKGESGANIQLILHALFWMFKKGMFELKCEEDKEETNFDNLENLYKLMNDDGYGPFVTMLDYPLQI
jgi:hypothetical protein